MAAICQLALALAEDTTIDQDIRKHISTRRASAFIEMCLARKPPTGLEDPVAIFGWDRVAVASILVPLQDECAEVITSCTKLAYRQHMTPYLPEAENWYRRVVEYLTGVQYPIQLALIVCAGPERVAEELWEWNTKLAVLREAAGGAVTGEPGYPLPQGVMEHLCRLIGLDAVDMAQCDDTTKAQVREVRVVLTIRYLALTTRDSKLFLELGKDIKQGEMLSDKVFRLLRNEPLGVGQVRLVKLQVFDFEQMFGPVRTSPLP
ncbi:hypothetical protein EXIGLDRAFT_256751 [Exidia glandulosa HHB12029]|uniref:Uncharacterized protein n=1 Tax=Exidia glandulosa HHB12029 TaxID=1314781 RepID=A0A165DV71_EXIGL|nr:hypothetical protein EXIGLDRAFT_256751 [Exidia glandulosa HHB12029]